MDQNESALNTAAQRKPVGITLCHMAVVEWLFRAKLITQAERDFISDRKTVRRGLKESPRAPFNTFLVTTDDNFLNRSRLENLGGGTVIGCIDRHNQKELTHSLVKLSNGKLAGVNNFNATAGKCAKDEYAEFDIGDLCWNKSSDLYLDAKGYNAHLFSQHPREIAKRIKKYVAANQT